VGWYDALGLYSPLAWLRIGAHRHVNLDFRKSRARVYIPDFVRCLVTILMMQARSGDIISFRVDEKMQGGRVGWVFGTNAILGKRKVLMCI
jgi:hypothetical protein